MEVSRTTKWEKKTEQGTIEIEESIGSLSVLKGEYEPGNGTRYTALAVRYFHGNCGSLGAVQDGWIVVSGLTCKAWLFQKEGYLLDHYIKEHLGGLDGDYPYFGDLVRALLERPGGTVRPDEVPLDADKDIDAGVDYGEE